MRKLNKIVFLSVCLALAGACTAMASMQKIEVILEYGMSSSFDVSEGTQTMTSHNGAKVFLDDNTIYTFGTTNLTSTFTGVTDTSGTNPPGLASATFSGGNWRVQLYGGSPSHLVFDLQGTVDWYREQEATVLANKVDGVGKVSLNLSTLYIDSAFWGSGVTWGSDDGKSAIVSSITSAHHMPSGNLINYMADWASGNVTLVVYADSSMAVPEPATIGLLTLGGLLLRRKK